MSFYFVRVCQWVKSQRYELLTGVILIMAACAWYWPLISVGFLSDDFDILYVTSRRPNPLPYWGTNMIGTHVGSIYGPINNLLYSGEYFFFGLHPSWYHLVSLALHLAVCFVVYRLAQALTGEKLIGALAAIVFAFGQSHIESIAWISAQTHLVTTLAYVTAVYWYYLFVVQERRRYYWLAVAAEIVALFAKDSAVTLVAAFLALELVWGWRHSFFTTMKIIGVRLLAPAGILAVYLWLRFLTTGYVFGYYGAPFLALDLVHLARMLVTLSLNLFVPFPWRELWTHWLGSHLWLLGLIILSVIGVPLVAARDYERRRALMCCLLLYIISVGPFLALFLNASHDGGERYTYAASTFGFIYVISALLTLLARIKKSIIVPVVAIMIIVCSAGIFQRSKMRAWQESGRVVTRLVTTIPAAIFAGETKTLFIGLPDTIGPAEAMRNGISEAVSLVHRQPRPDAERIFMAQKLSVNQVKTDIVLVRVSDREYRLQARDGARIFTGFPRIDHALAFFSLENFRLDDHSGSGIYIELKTDAIQTLQADGKKPSLVYVSGGEWRVVPLAELIDTGGDY